MIDLIASWENPRPVRETREHEPPLERRVVDISIVVETNEDQEHVMRELQRFIVGLDMDPIGRKYARMPRWIRRVDVIDMIPEGDDA